MSSISNAFCGLITILCKHGNDVIVNDDCELATDNGKLMIITKSITTCVTIFLHACQAVQSPSLLVSIIEVIRNAISGDFPTLSDVMKDTAFLSDVMITYAIQIANAKLYNDLLSTLWCKKQLVWEDRKVIGTNCADMNRIGLSYAIYRYIYDKENDCQDSFFGSQLLKICTDPDKQEHNSLTIDDNLFSRKRKMPMGFHNFSNFCCWFNCILQIVIACPDIIEKARTFLYTNDVTTIEYTSFKEGNRGGKRISQRLVQYHAWIQPPPTFPSFQETRTKIEMSIWLCKILVFARYAPDSVYVMDVLNFFDEYEFVILHDNFRQYSANFEPGNKDFRNMSSEFGRMAYVFPEIFGHSFMVDAFKKVDGPVECPTCGIKKIFPVMKQYLVHIDIPHQLEVVSLEDIVKNTLLPNTSLTARCCQDHNPPRCEYEFKYRDRYDCKNCSLLAIELYSQTTGNGTIHEQENDSGMPLTSINMSKNIYIEDDEKIKLTLSGIVVHSNGHYKVYLKKSSTVGADFFLCDDSNVTETTFESNMSSLPICFALYQVERLKSQTPKSSPTRKNKPGSPSPTGGSRKKQTPPSALRSALGSFSDMLKSSGNYVSSCVDTMSNLLVNTLTSGSSSPNEDTQIVKTQNSGSPSAIEVEKTTETSIQEPPRLSKSIGFVRTSPKLCRLGSIMNIIANIPEIIEICKKSENQINAAFETSISKTDGLVRLKQRDGQAQENVELFTLGMIFFSHKSTARINTTELYLKLKAQSSVQSSANFEESDTKLMFEALIGNSECLKGIFEIEMGSKCLCLDVRKTKNEWSQDENDTFQSR